MARTHTQPQAVDRIRISIMDPPSRTPLVEDRPKGLDAETVVDLRDAAFDAQIGPLLGAVDGQRDGERLRVRVRSVSPATLAALQTAGARYQIIANGEGADLLVWRQYTPEQRERYFRQAVDGR